MAGPDAPVDVDQAVTGTWATSRLRRVLERRAEWVEALIVLTTVAVGVRRPRVPGLLLQGLFPASS